MGGRWVEGPPFRRRTPEELDAAALAEAKARSEMLGYGGAFHLEPKSIAAIRRQMEQWDDEGAADPTGWHRVWIEDPLPADYRERSKITGNATKSVLRLTLYSNYLEPADVTWVERAAWNKGEQYT